MSERCMWGTGRLGQAEIANVREHFSNRGLRGFKDSSE